MNKRRGYSDRDDDRESPKREDGHDTHEMKKSRLEDESGPSRVVHIRSVPNTANEEHLALLAVPFGKLDNMIYARKNNQALLELEDIQAARDMVDYYRQNPPTLSGRTVIVQFSRHNKLDTRSDNNHVERAIENANDLHRKQSGGMGSYNFGRSGGGSNIPIMPSQRGMSPLSGGNLGGGGSSGLSSNDFSSVLHVMMDNRTNEPINHLLLYKVFHQFGRIQRIIMFTKMRTEHGLIEFDSPVGALTARLQLDGKALLGGRYPMRIEFSKMKQLEVRTENEKCRDFERSPLTEMERYAIGALSLVSDLVVDGTGSNVPAMSAGNNAGSNFGASNMSSVGGGMYGQRSSGGQSSLGGALSNWGMMGSGSGGGGGSSQDPLANIVAALGLPRGGTGLSMGMDNYVGGGGHSGSGDYSRMSGNMHNDNGRSGDGNSVIIVSNLSEEKVEPDALFTLFGVYGDVQRVKIMYSKKDTALIQFSNGSQAQTAKEHLNNVVLWDRPMKINISRHGAIQMPREETDVGLTKDYSNSSLHRFKNPMSKNYKNIFPPSPVLHLSNIPSDFSEDEVSDIFQNKGYDVVNFRFLRNDSNKKKMALVQLSSVEDAVQALVEMHNHELSSTSHLRVSFSSRIQNKN